MRRAGAAILAACLWVGGCATEPTLTPSQLNANAASYDGKTVRVRAWLVYKFEDIGLWDSEAAYESRQDGSCVSYEGPDLGKTYASRMVTLTGIFTKDLYYNPNPNVVTISNGWCNKTGVKVGR